MKITRENMDKILKAKADYQEELERKGSNLSFHYIRIYPDGYFFFGKEPSKSIPESEYNGSDDAPITIQIGGNCHEPAGPESGHIWDQCPRAEAEFYGNDYGNYHMDFKDIPEGEYSEEISSKLSKKFSPRKLGGWADYPDNLDEENEKLLIDRGVEIA